MLLPLQSLPGTLHLRSEARKRRPDSSTVSTELPSRGPFRTGGGCHEGALGRRGGTSCLPHPNNRFFVIPPSEGGDVPITGPQNCRVCHWDAKCPGPGGVRTTRKGAQLAPSIPKAVNIVLFSVIKVQPERRGGTRGDPESPPASLASGSLWGLEVGSGEGWGQWAHEGGAGRGQVH